MRSVCILLSLFLLAACQDQPATKEYLPVPSREPDCLIGVNWSIGLPDNPDQYMVLPEDLEEGFPIRYFPSDFRMGDPNLPVAELSTEPVWADL